LEKILKDDEEFVSRDWGMIPPEYEKHPNYENVYIVPGDPVRHFEVKNDNVYSSLKLT
jgi:hypothetical protein